MMNIRQRTINVDRKKLLDALKLNRSIHAKEYQAALLSFKSRLLTDLEAAIEHVRQSEPYALKNFEMDVDFPVNHDQDFADVIDMLEHSTDEVINIDNESFKAYFKNEWTWTNHFRDSVSNYSIGSFLKS